MNETTLAVLQIVGRLSVVVLCYYATTKICGCRKNCSRWRQQLRSVLGWLSGAVACIGLFYPVICGVAALILVAALWASEFDYGFEKAKAIRFQASRSSISDAGSRSGS